MEDLRNWQKKFEECCYTKKLLNKVVYLNSIMRTTSVDIEEVKKAIYYARKYHGNQMRQSGEPYYSHPIAVAYMVADYLFRTDILVTSILHDTIEDTDLTKEKILTIFGERISNQVMDLTRVKEYAKITSAEMIKILYNEQKDEILLIKLFDRIHNMHTISAKSPDKIERITQETLDEFIILATYLDLPRARYNLIGLLSKPLPNFSELYKPYINMTNKFQHGSHILFPTHQYDILQKQILKLLE